MPNPHKLRSFTTCFLCFETIICLYLLISLVTVEDVLKDDQDMTITVLTYRRANTCFVFICMIPFIFLRVASLLCCKSPRYIFCKVIFIWVLNLILVAAWCLTVLIKIFLLDEMKPNSFTYEFFNCVLILTLTCMSICTVLCGIPLYLHRVCLKATKNRQLLSRKLAEISLLPKERYDTQKHTSLAFCTVCLDEFKNKKSEITYLPCDARHYFHSACIKTWCLTQ